MSSSIDYGLWRNFSSAYNHAGVTMRVHRRGEVLFICSYDKWDFAAIEGDS